MILVNYFQEIFFKYIILGHTSTIYLFSVCFQNDSFTVPISGLNYSWTEYQVRVKMVSLKANLSDTRLWSDAAIVSGMTMSQPPGHSPVTCQASFQINRYPQTRDIFVYWQKIDQRFYNGPNFHYEIANITSGGEPVAYSPDEVTESFAKFSRLPYNKSFEFSVVSVNDEGSAPESSLVTVPVQELITSITPRSVTTIYHGNQLKISWFKPQDVSQVESYTIFWCQRGPVTDTHCYGKLEFEHVNVTAGYVTDGVVASLVEISSNDALIFSLNLTTTDTEYILYVAANTEQGSSGMEESVCTIINDKLKDGWVREVLLERVGDTWTQVRWSMPCSDRSGLVLGYNVTWCAAGEDTCASDHVTHSAEFSMVHNITGLAPWSEYTVTVTPINLEKEGQPSDKLEVRTLASAPGSPPTTLKLTSVSNISAAFSWDKPIRANGPISHYKVS